MRKRNLVPGGLWAIGLTVLLMAGCSSFRSDVSAYEKDGVQYGVTKGTFRNRWWNFYERGCSFLDGGFYKEAEADFRTALQDRSKDQRWPRTYGLHFIPEYFPNRELGIALYYQQQVEAGIYQLEVSLEQSFSARGAFYVAEARKQWLATTGKDTESPEIQITAPTADTIIGATEVTLEGIARDDMFVEKIDIEGDFYDVRLCAAEVSFAKTVPLTPGQNTIHLTVTDLMDKRTEIDVPVVSDVDGPLVSFNAPLVAPGTLQGVLFDPSGVVSMQISGKEAILSQDSDGVVKFMIELAMGEMTPPLHYECLDKIGNVTRGTLPLDMLVINEQIPEILLASRQEEYMPLGAGLYALMINGEKMAIAATPAAKDGVTIEMSNIHDGQTYFMDEIVVAVKVDANNPIETIELNGLPIPTIPGRNSLRTSRKINLEGTGEIRLTAKAVDTGGAVGEEHKIIQREKNSIEIDDGRLSIAFLGNLEEATYPEADNDIVDIFKALGAHEAVTKRYTVVERGEALDEAMAEQSLSEMLGSKKQKLITGMLVPAELMIGAYIRRDQQTVTITLVGSSTETAVRILPMVDVAGPYDELERLIEELGVRLAQEIPRAEGRVLRWEQPKITTNLHESQGIRDNLKCIIFRIEDVPGLEPGEIAGQEPKILCEGLLTNVMEKLSTAIALPDEEGQDLETLNIEPGYHVIIK